MRVAITSENNQQVFNQVMLKGSIEKVTIDLNSWCDDNHDVVSAAWETVTGNVTVSSDVVTLNILTALLTAAEAGNSLIKCTITTSAEKYVVLINILVRDPSVATGDYKFV